MQTFLPYSNIEDSLACLDMKRLGKQRVEAYQILRTLTGASQGWKNHPAVKMWKGYKFGLACYGLRACELWKRHGYKDSLWGIFDAMLDHLAGLESLEKEIFPSWMQNGEFHASHRSNLLRKDPVFYGKYGWKEPPDLPYVWPVK